MEKSAHWGWGSNRDPCSWQSVRLLVSCALRANPSRIRTLACPPPTSYVLKYACTYLSLSTPPMASLSLSMSRTRISDEAHDYFLRCHHLSKSHNSLRNWTGVSHALEGNLGHKAHTYLRPPPTPILLQSALKPLWPQALTNPSPSSSPTC